MCFSAGIAFLASHNVLCIVFSYSFISKNVLISFLFLLWSFGLLKSALFNFHMRLALCKFCMKFTNHGQNYLKEDMICTLHTFFLIISL